MGTKMTALVWSFVSVWLLMRNAATTSASAVVLQRTFRVANAPFPAKMSSFALNPDTKQHLATVSATTNMVYLFANVPNSFYEGDNNKTALEPTHTQVVGNLPTDIVYKIYSGVAYWIVACAHDAHLHVLDASTLNLVQSIAFSGVGATRVSASLSNKDPFVYYNYVPNGAGYKSPEVGVIHIGDLADRGRVPTDWDNTSIAASISADGKMLYNTGEHVGFSSYILANGNTANADDAFDGVGAPSFTLNYCQVESQRPNSRVYNPDPSDSWVSTRQVLLEYGLVDRGNPSISAALYTPDTTISFASCPTCCPYPNLYKDWAAVGGVTLADVPIVAFSDGLGFGFVNGFTPYNNNGGYNNYNNNNGDYGGRPSARPDPMTQVAGVVVDKNHNDFGRATAHNITVPNTLLGILSSSFSRDPYGKYDSTIYEQEEEEEEYQDAPMGDMQVSSAAPHILAVQDHVFVVFGDQVGSTSYPCFLSDDGNGGAFDLQLDTVQFVINDPSGAAHAQFDTNRYDLAWNGLPEGALYDDTSQTIRWTPTLNQVGLYTVQAILTDKNGNVKHQCVYTVDLEASYPSFHLSHGAERIHVTNDGSAVAAWTANQWQRGNSNVTLIDVATGAMSTAQLNYVASQIVIGPHMLVVFEQYCGTIHLLDRSSPYLSEFKSMPNPAVMNRYDCDNDFFFTVDEVSGLLHICRNCNGNNQQPTSLDISGTDSVVEVEADKPYYKSDASNSDPWVEGILKNGILYDHLDRNKPLLVLDHGPFYVGGKLPDLSNAYMHPEGYVDFEGDEDDEFFDRSSSAFDFLHPVPNRNGYQMVEVPQAGVFVQIQMGQQDRMVHTINSTLIVLDLTGREVDSFPFFYVHQERNQQGYYNSYYPILKGRNKALFVGFGSTVFRWEYEGEPPSVLDQKSFHFQDVQTKFHIPPDDPSVSLQHTLIGGTGPFDIFLQYPTSESFDVSAVKRIVLVDETTGTLTVNGEALYKEATNALVTFGVAKGLPEVRSASLKTIEPWSVLPQEEQPPSGGLPVALPIFLRAVDQKGEKASLEYFVYTHVQYEMLVTLINDALDELQNPGNNNTQSNNDNASSSGDSRDLEIELLIAMVVLLIMILLLLVCFLVYKLVLQGDKETAAQVQKEEVDGLIRTDGDAASTSSNRSDEAAIKEFRDGPTPETTEGEESVENKDKETEIV